MGKVISWDKQALRLSVDTVRSKVHIDVLSDISTVYSNVILLRVLYMCRPHTVSFWNLPESYSI